MINKNLDPVAWSGLLYELEDAREHLDALVTDLENDPDFDETDFKIQLGHVFTHLNRAWYRRNRGREMSESEWAAASKFPSDLEPIA